MTSSRGLMLCRSIVMRRATIPFNPTHRQLSPALGALPSQFSQLSSDGSSRMLSTHRSSQKSGLQRTQSRNQAPVLASLGSAESPGDPLQRLLLRPNMPCPGCGVKLQDGNPDLPGFYVIPKMLLEPKVEEEEEELIEEREEELSGPVPMDWSGPSDQYDDRKDRQVVGGPQVIATDDDASVDDTIAAFDNALDDWFPEDEDQDDPMRGSTWRIPKKPEARKDVVCTRCYNLRHYGRISKDGTSAVETLLPSFDFKQQVGVKLLACKSRAVVMLVVDLADFDGSFPREVVKVLREMPDVQVMLVVTKLDLVPTVATLLRLEKWVRMRAKAGGLVQPDGVHIVSNTTGAGLDVLLAQLEKLCGKKGEVWVVGAQNAGKSSLINALTGHKGGNMATKAHVTAAALPGTTVGCIQLNEVLPAPHKVWDTPGVLQAHQITTRLHTAELQMVLPRRRLKPRTYRIPKGSTLHMGGLVRLDVVDCPGATMYLTVWASSDVCVHLGKTEKAEALFEQHIGGLLTPPIGDVARIAELGELTKHDVFVEGMDYKQSHMDVAIAGLGWIGTAVAGGANLRVWAYPGVSVTTRAALIPDMAKEWEKPGFGKTPKPVAIKEPAAKKSNGGGKKKKIYTSN
eukprot:CAMPEP_0198205970 /NCGR_PEP_ID=MMETSP1445-20131203/9494_1 /TAXON_ID=36898 /ORGANISM="Pyramimonas sp., Strain CCMP2087" /LENGTH=627 /DNA_ID=CAMNT_0043878475 /DNA_START=46 /DNA_END=1929 /DNA_ORIENTATION=+